VYVSRRTSDALVARLRRNYAAVLLAGGRLPETGRAWIEQPDRAPGEPVPEGRFRWSVVTENGWTNIGGMSPVLLVANAPTLYFHRLDDGRCCVDVTTRRGARL
jgi:hypothetical protein